jgi:hypothetical protein
MATDFTPRRGTKSGPDCAGPLPLDTLAGTFWALTTGPRPPLVLPGRSISADLPDRPVVITELQDHPDDEVRGALWRELVRRYHGGDRDWRLGLIGMALPGLQRVFRKLARGYGGDLFELQNVILDGFLTALDQLDVDGIEGYRICAHLCWAGRRAGSRFRWAEAEHAARHRPFDETLHDAPDLPWDHEDFVLGRAVHAGVITRAEADLIGRSRLDRVPLRVLAADAGVCLGTIWKRRADAEAMFTAAYFDGEI